MKNLLSADMLFRSGGEEEEEQQEAADQLREGQQEAAEGFQGRPGQDQAAAAADQGERPGPAPAAVPVLRRAQASTAPEGARIPQANRAVKYYNPGRARLKNDGGA